MEQATFTVKPSSNLHENIFVDYPNLRNKLSYFGLVDISCLFSKSITEAIINEMHQLVKTHHRRNDFLSKHTETPRNLNTVSEAAITNNSIVIPKIYYSPEIKYMLSQIAGEIIHDLPWTGERYVLNQLSEQNDTHGWHWDDYSYALVFIAEAPEGDKGGLLECIPHTYWNRSNPQIYHLLETRKIAQYYFQPGSYYFMRSDTTLHRVTPITSNKKRMSLAMSYCSESDLEKPIDHKTVIDLYGK